nr:unnamed protein product [Naegleria fowleri]
MPGHSHRRKHTSNFRAGSSSSRNSGKASSSSSSASSSSGPNTIDNVVEKVMMWKEQFMFDDCIKLLNKTIKQFSSSPRVVDLLFLMGEVYLQNGDSLNAKHFLQQAVQVNPKHYPSLMYLGQVSEANESAQYFSQGLTVMQELLNSNSGNIEEIKQLYIQGLCSVCELYMTDLCFEPNAEQECEKCVGMAQEFYRNVSIQNWDVGLLQTLAHLRMCQCKPEEGKQFMQVVAQKVIEEGNRLKESTDSSFNDLVMGYDFKLSTAKNLIELQMHQEAKTILEQLKDQFDQVVDLWYLLGICCDSLGQSDVAIKYLEKALKIGKQIQEDGMFLNEVKDELNLIKQKLSQSGVQNPGSDLIDEDEDEWEDVVEDYLESNNEVVDEDDDAEMNG